MAELGARGGEALRQKMKGHGTVAADVAPPPPETLADAKQLASWAVHAVVTGELNVKVAREVSSLLREFRSASKEADLAKDLEELRGKVDELKRGSR